MNDGKRLVSIAGAICLILAASTATAQVEFDCIPMDSTELDVNVAIISQIGLAADDQHNEASQIVGVSTQPYRMKDPTVVINAQWSACNAAPIPFEEADYSEPGRFVRILIQAGTFISDAEAGTPPGGFEGTMLFVQDYPIAAGQLIPLLDANGQTMWKLPLPDIPTILPADVEIHVAIIGVGFSNPLDNPNDPCPPYLGGGERFAVMVVPEPATCSTEHAWRTQFVGPLAPAPGDPPNNKWLSEIDPSKERIVLSFTPEFVEPVPTVSEWGAAAMTLLILTAGTLVYRCRMPTVVEA